MAIDTQHFGKKEKQSHSDSVGQEKHERLARESLRDLILFYKALEEEMRKIASAVEQGMPVDRELFDKMAAVKEKYLKAMQLLREEDGDRGRHAMIVFADAVQDMMTHMHRKAKH